MSGVTFEVPDSQYRAILELMQELTQMARAFRERAQAQRLYLDLETDARADCEREGSVTSFEQREVVRRLELKVQEEELKVREEAVKLQHKALELMRKRQALEEKKLVADAYEVRVRLEELGARVMRADLDKVRLRSERRHPPRGQQRGGRPSPQGVTEAMKEGTEVLQQPEVPQLPLLAEIEKALQQQ